ncbi:MAG: DUF917 family protein [Parcubacteria group bacterium]|jgi:DUF917 family protein
MKITKKNLDTYLKGSQFLATGGGLPLQMHKKIFTQIIRDDSEISPKDLRSFSDEDYLISAYGVGDPSCIPDGFDRAVVRAFQKYKDLTQKEITGIIPGEIGAEGLSFLISRITGIPVADADLVGGRAAPEIQLDVFSVYDLPITPTLLIAINGKSIYLEGQFTAQDIEKISRDFFDLNGSSGLLIGYGISAKDFARYAITGSLTLALQIGQVLDRDDMQSLTTICGGSIISTTIVKKVELKSRGGFLSGEIICADGIMQVKNENIQFEDQNGQLYVAPDILMFINGRGEPIHNTLMKKYIGKTVRLIHIPAIGYWATKKARALWHDIIK